MSCDSYTQRSASFIFGPGGGRSWWAHFEFTRMNIEPIILCKKIEERSVVGAMLASLRRTRATSALLSRSAEERNNRAPHVDVVPD